MEQVTMTPTASTPGVVVSERDRGGFIGHHDRGLESKDLTAILTPSLVGNIKDNAVSLAIQVKDTHIALERVRADTLTAHRETNALIAEQAHRTRELIREMEADRIKTEASDLRGKLMAAAAGKIVPVITV